MIKKILKEHTHLLSLTISVIITIPAAYGIFILVYLFAWLNLGEGANSSLYSNYTMFIISSISMVITNITLYFILQFWIQKNSLKIAKSILITSILVMAFYFLQLLTFFFDF